MKSKVNVGDRFQINMGGTVTVLEYNSSKEVVVEFDSHPGATTKATSGNILKGSVHNPHLPTVAGKGVVGFVKSPTTYPAYFYWTRMLNRCYTSERRKLPAYEGCSVSKDWHQLDNFISWYDGQRKEPDWHLDKDLLNRRNSVYGADYCSLLPREINTFLTDRYKHRGQWPPGVTYHERILKWQAACNVDGKSKYLGVFYSPEEAFLEYKRCKEAWANALADRWDGRIEDRACEALRKYTVEITD